MFAKWPQNKPPRLIIEDTYNGFTINNDCLGEKSMNQLKALWLIQHYFLYLKQPLI